MNILFCDDFEQLFFVLIISFYSTLSYENKHVLIDYKVYVTIDETMTLIQIMRQQENSSAIVQFRETFN